MSVTTKRQENRAVFGAGCFWGVESAFMAQDGVIETAVGYMGGHILSPGYREVCSGSSGHAEIVQLAFDPERVTYKDLVALFWRIHDPTQLDRQGPDIGTQYRSVIFYYDNDQKDIAEKSLADHQTKVSPPIATRIEIVRDFWRAEDYHQKYLQKKGISGA